MPELVGYARVSTADQNLSLQIEALKAAGVHPDRLHVEKRSAVSNKRPELEYALMDLREGDTFVVWRIDRLARSMRDLYSRLDKIYAAGASFRSLQENFDFGTVSGKLVLGVLGLVAEFERQIIAQRTSAGIAVARKNGNGKWGRDLFMTPERIAQVGKLLNSGMSGPKVAERMKISTASVYAHWKQSAPGVFVRKKAKAAGKSGRPSNNYPARILAIIRKHWPPQADGKRAAAVVKINKLIKPYKVSRVWLYSCAGPPGTKAET